jgi:hypothetical protein
MEPPNELPLDLANAWNRPLVDTGAEQPITFGDMVRVRPTEEAQAAGLAGLVGKVVGETMPSMSGEKGVLTPRIDYAIGVRFDEHEQTLFLPHDVLEFIDHGPGQVFRIQTKRGRTTWVRLESGEWTAIEEPVEPPMPTGGPPESEPTSLLRRLLTFVRQRF